MPITGWPSDSATHPRQLLECERSTPTGRPSGDRGWFRTELQLRPQDGKPRYAVRSPTSSVAPALSRPLSEGSDTMTTISANILAGNRDHAIGSPRLRRVAFDQSGLRRNSSRIRACRSGEVVHNGSHKPPPSFWRKPRFIGFIEPGCARRSELAHLPSVVDRLVS